MPEIKASVGEGGKNNVSDVAIVQVMLVNTHNEKNQPYLPAYDGDCGKHTKDAIAAFQKDHVFVSRPGYMDAGAGLAAAVGTTKPGLINPGDETFQKLTDSLPDDYKLLRSIDGCSIVYLPGTAADLDASQNDLNSRTFDDHFVVKVGRLFDEMFEKYGIVLSVTSGPDAEGARRDFETQYKLLFKVVNGKVVTHAGPGESNHNFGQAADVGFNELRWIRRDGVVEENEDYWLNRMVASYGTGKTQIAHGNAVAQHFWEAMQEVATNGKAKLFRGPDWDQPHVQAWDDDLVDMASRLADLMNRVGTMKWRGFQQVYKCDFGLGGEYYRVGLAREIWSLHAGVKKNDLAKARQRALKAKTRPHIPDTDITAMRKSLKDDFEAADDKWEKWTSQ